MICPSPESRIRRQEQVSEVSEALAVSAARLAVGLERSVREFVAADENLGSIELAVEQQSRELLRQATEKAGRGQQTLGGGAEGGWRSCNGQNRAAEIDCKSRRSGEDRSERAGPANAT